MIDLAIYLRFISEIFFSQFWKYLKKTTILWRTIPFFDHSQISMIDLLFILLMFVTYMPCLLEFQSILNIWNDIIGVCITKELHKFCLASWMTMFIF